MTSTTLEDIQKDLRSRHAIVTLKKLEIKPGKETATKVRAGATQKGTLAKPLAIGHPVCFQSKREPNYYFGATTIIMKIEEVSQGLQIETETSIYLLT